MKEKILNFIENSNWLWVIMGIVGMGIGLLCQQSCNGQSREELYKTVAVPMQQIKQPPCEAIQIPKSKLRTISSMAATSGFTKTITCYWEVGYDTYVACGKSVPATKKYITEVFAEVQKLYKADSIIIVLDSIGVWTKREWYPYTSSSDVLYSFASRMDSIKPTADVYHLISSSGANFGGISFVGGVGQSSYYRCSFSNIYIPYYLYPNYSWTVEVISHETGHMLGSQHTHWCGWLWPDGTTHPIDSCYTCEGACCNQHPTIPGTIMSYCHITSQGIDFHNGFGMLPRNAIRETIYNSYLQGLLKNPDGGASFVAAVIPDTTVANVTFTPIVNGKYKYHIKPVGQAAYNTAVTTTLNNIGLSALASTTNYFIQVKSLYGGVWSTWSKAYKFITK